MKGNSFSLTPLKRAVAAGIEIALIPVFFIFTLRSRFRLKPIDVGIGPTPFISHPYHKQALQRYGHSAETFVTSVWFVTEAFDIRADKIVGGRIPFFGGLTAFLAHVYLGFLTLSRYRCITGISTAVRSASDRSAAPVRAVLLQRVAKFVSS